ncbi:MAG TPA: replication factor C large subunit [Candidatus Norongarragalinales archaeon]|jgi:replication factor C large subunit|nr:replication factor C large subunit [Candidatus Norongarragalinales archaeon]
MVKERFLPWAQKHAPKNLDEVAGNTEAREEMKRWALEFERGKPQKPLLISGPPGVGKSAAAVAMALQFEWDLVESNAGELRNKEALARLMGLSTASMGLFGNRRLLLIDEVDAAFDRGEIPEVVTIVKEAKQPLVLIANDIWNPRLAPIRFLCKPVEFKGVNWKSIEGLLNKISRAEGVDCGFAETIARSCEGDLRSAINDLQASCAGGGSGALLSMGKRDREENVFDAVRGVFHAKSYIDAVRAADGIDVDLDTFTKWIAENVTAEYDGRAGDVASAFNWLSRADVFQGRIRRRQHWGFLRYIRPLALAGVALSRTESTRAFVKYSFPSILKKLSASKQSREMLKSASLKVGNATHESGYSARFDSLPFISHVPGAGKFFKWSDDEASLLADLYNPPGGKKSKSTKH